MSGETWIWGKGRLPFKSLMRPFLRLKLLEGVVENGGMHG